MEDIPSFWLYDCAIFDIIIVLVGIHWKTEGPAAKLVVRTT